jgi:hypothetical protein
VSAVESAQVAVFLAYAAPGGYTLIDREVYLARCSQMSTAVEEFVFGVGLTGDVESVAGEEPL